VGGSAGFVRRPNVIYWRKWKPKPGLSTVVFLFPPLYAHTFAISYKIVPPPVHLSYPLSTFTSCIVAHFVVYTDFPPVDSRAVSPSRLLKYIESFRRVFEFRNFKYPCRGRVEPDRCLRFKTTRTATTDTLAEPQTALVDVRR